MATQFQIGDRVRYSSEFCRIIGARTGITPQRRGVITGFWGRKDYPLAHIKWDGEPLEPGRSHNGGSAVSNLQRQTPKGWVPKTLN